MACDAIQKRLSAYSSSEIKFNLIAMVQDRRTYLGRQLDALAPLGVKESDPAMLAVRSELRAEEEKRAGLTAENERSRHNYLPFCVELLRSLAGSGGFEGLVEEARGTAGGKRKRAEARMKGSGK